MTRFVKAIYEGGVLRPLEPVDLPDHAEVEIAILSSTAALADSLLAKRGAGFIGIGRSGRRDISERAEELLRNGFGR